MSTWPTIERLIAEQGAAALVTVVHTQGSSPREAGARMVVAPDGTFTGTIGGGALEWGALAEAQALMTRRSAMVSRLDKALGPDLGQCCGGRVQLAIERFDAADRDAIAPLAAAEKAGPLVTSATLGSDGRLRRQIAGLPESAPSGPAYEAGEDGRVTGLRCVRADWTDGQLKEVEGSEFTLKADLILLAMGFLGPRKQGLLSQAGVTLDQRGNVSANTNDYATSEPGVFACGDMRRGQSLVVWAIREGRQCARAVDEMLMGASELPR